MTNAKKPRCLIPRRTARLIIGNALYVMRETILPVLGELLAGLLLIGGAAIFFPLLLLSFA